MVPFSPSASVPPGTSCPHTLHPSVLFTLLLLPSHALSWGLFYAFPQESIGPLRFSLSLFLVSEMLLPCSLVATRLLEFTSIVPVSPLHLLMQVIEILHCQVPSQLSFSPGSFPDFSSCPHPLLRPFCLCLYWEACFLLWFIVFIGIQVLLRSLPWIPTTRLLKTGNCLR